MYMVCIILISHIIRCGSMVGYNDVFIMENAVVLSVGCINVTWKLVPSANLGPTPDLRSQRNSGGFTRSPGSLRGS